MKKILSFVLIFICCLSINVYANVDCNKYACAECIYKDNHLTFTIKLESSGNGSAELQILPKKNDGQSVLAYNISKSALVAKNFIDSNTNKLFCPDYIHVKYNAGASTKIGVELPGKEEKGTTLANLSSKTNNELLVTDGNGSSARSCSYDFKTITGNNNVKVTISLLSNGELKYELSDGYKINTNNNNFDITPEDFANGCPNINGQCGSYGDDKYCSITKNGHFDVLDRDQAQSGEEETEYDTTKNNSNNESNNLYDNVTTAEVNCNTLGLLRKDLQGIFKVFKIVAPILVIAMSTYDFIKALTGKVEGEMKKAFTKLLKRLAFALILFFLPNILDFFLGLISDGYTTCINDI